MVGELVDVMATPIAFQNACEVQVSDHSPHSLSTNRYQMVGGFTIELDPMRAHVYLRQCGPHMQTVRASFHSDAEAGAEYKRLLALLEVRESVRWCENRLQKTVNLIPDDFWPLVRRGNFDALLVAADWWDEHDEPDRELLLRAAHYHLLRQPNVAVRAGLLADGYATIVYNPQQVTPNRPYPEYARVPVAVVVTPGKSIRIVSIETLLSHAPATQLSPARRTETTAIQSRTFKVGDQAEHGSYNLVYYGSIQTITEKTVVIFDRTYDKTRRLSIGEFVFRNHDFDLARAQKRNSEWMD